MNRILGAALVLTGLVACGGGSPVKQYVVTIGSAQTQAGPNAECSAVQTTGTARTVRVNENIDGNWIIYQGEKDKWFLENAKQTLEGTFANSTYTFNGSSLQDTVFPSLATKNYEIKDLSTIQVTAKIDGQALTGSYTTEHKVTCDNLADANQCKGAQYGAQTPGDTIDCITTGTLNGTQLPDAQYQYQTGTPGDGSSGTNL